MAEIRDLARAASSYEEALRSPQEAAVHRSGFVDLDPQAQLAPTAEWDGDAPRAAGERTAPWTRQWSVIEGGDLTPWMSPEEREQAAGKEMADLVAPRLRRPFPFTPTHEYVHEIYDPAAEVDQWRPERHDFMVVNREAYGRDSWDRGSSPDFILDRQGGWWADGVGRAFEPDNAPAELPWRYIPWQDEKGSWNTLAAKDEVEFIPRGDDRSTAEVALDSVLPGWRDLEGSEERVRSAYGEWPSAKAPVDLDDAVYVALGEGAALSSPETLAERDESSQAISPARGPMRERDRPVSDDDVRHADFVRAREEDRLDALDAERESEWAARERAAQSLDRLYDSGREVDRRTAPESDALVDVPPEEPQRTPSAGIEWSPPEREAIHRGVEHDLDIGLD
jgi:hypothetical protein